MSKDKLTGAALLAISIIIMVVYNVAMWIFPLGSKVPLFLVELTDSLIVIVVLGILAYIGYTLVTTPPPKPIEEIEKELEKELKAITQKTQQGGGQSAPSSS
ncbi:MAG: transcriptional regulator [Acidilobus sp.]